MTTTTLKYLHREQSASLQDIASTTWTLLGLLIDRSHQRHQLATLSAEQLLDMGITREAALEEAGKPFWRT